MSLFCFVIDKSAGFHYIGGSVLAVTDETNAAESHPLIQTQI